MKLIVCGSTPSLVDAVRVCCVVRDGPAPPVLLLSSSAPYGRSASIG